MKTKTQRRNRFAVGAHVRVKMPGVDGVVTQLDSDPTALGEYWHTIHTEYAELREPGCNIELIPAPLTNARPRKTLGIIPPNRPQVDITKQGAFFAGQPFDALSAAARILAMAKTRLMLIDGYLGADTLICFPLPASISTSSRSRRSLRRLRRFVRLSKHNTPLWLLKLLPRSMIVSS
jgi:hypothetical protein